MITPRKVYLGPEPQRFCNSRYPKTSKDIPVFGNIDEHLEKLKLKRYFVKYKIPFAL